MEPVRCSGFCAPFLIYFVIGLIVVIVPLFFGGKKAIISGIGSFIWFVLVCILLYYLCKKCHKGWAWIILIVMVLISLFIGGISLYSFRSKK